MAGANDGFVARFSFPSGDPTTVSVGNLSATVGSRVSIRGRLTDATGAGIGGKRLQFSIDSGAWTDSEVLTSALGYGTLTITAPA
ncbi:MAG: hypothetical protein NT029_22140, partial [Armatimonadetes bacterium]|nr:hypothetical protein [Armatimonadota bacterium]